MSQTTGVVRGLAFYEHVHAYAEQVRSHLVDLTAEQVEELTDGLEADLAEALADAPGALHRASPDGRPGGPSEGGDTTVLDLTAQFGPAAEYAAELRSAAGLGAGPGPTAPAGLRGSLAGARGGLVDAWSRLAQGWRVAWEPVTSTRSWQGFREFCTTFAPVGWLLRAWLVGQLVRVWTSWEHLTVLPREAEHVLLFVGLAVLSVQWGRGRWLPGRGRWAPRAWNVLAVLLVWPILALVADGERSAGYDGYSRGYDYGFSEGVAVASGAPVGHAENRSGVWVDGIQVSNLFAYDAAGELMHDVQLFDDRGRQVRTIAAGWEGALWRVPDSEADWGFVPAVSTDGRDRWNVYPLRGYPVVADEYGYQDGPGSEYDQAGRLIRRDADAQDLPVPFFKAPTVIPGLGGDPDGTDGQPDRTAQNGDAGTEEGAPSGTDPESSSVESSRDPEHARPDRASAVVEAGTVP